jgi:hypothetical protein
LSGLAVDTVDIQQRLMGSAYAILGLIVLLYLYAAITSKSVVDSIRRAFLEDLSRPTATQLVNLRLNDDSGLTEVFAGSPVNFLVEPQGIRPVRVLLPYSVDDGKFFSVEEFAPGRNDRDAWLVTLNNVQLSMDYYLTGGDAETPRRHLKVLPAPTVTSVAVDLAFPRYTKVPPRTNIECGTVEAIIGTQVTVHAKTNMPAHLANLNLNTTNEAPPPMEISGEDSTVLTGTFVVKESGSYTIHFTTGGGQGNPSPGNYDIIAIPDRAPTAKFLQPDWPDLKVPANVNVDLVISGSDDHGIKDATLLVKLGNDVLISKNVLEGRPVQPEFRATETLGLAQFGVKPGSKLTYKMTVRDNNEPSSNKTETEQRAIEVIVPVAPAEKQAIEEIQRKQAEQQNPPADTTPELQTAPEEKQNQPDETK